jgi:UDP-N-acetylmuramyl tripeptide synthase
MNLRHLVEAIRRSGGELEVGAELGTLDLEILHVTDQVSEVGPHSLLVIPKGAPTDTVSKAAGFGAGALLVEKPVLADIPVVRVRNARRAMGVALGALHRYPTDRLLATAVLGRRGKTLTAFMLAAILSRNEIPTGLLSSILINTGRAASGANGLPEPTAAYDLLEDMTKSGLGSAIVELPPSVEATDYYAGLAFDLAICTESGAESLSPPEDLVPDLKPHGRILCLDPELFPDESQLQPRAEVVAQRRADQLVIGGEAADFRAIRVADGKWVLQPRRGLAGLSGGSLDVAEVIVRPPSPGRANLAAALLASAAALLYGVTPSGVENALARFPGVFRRFQTVYSGPFTVIDDHPVDPVSLVQSLTDMAGLTSTPLIPLVAVYGGLGPRFNMSMAEKLVQTMQALGSKRAIIVECRGDAPLWAMASREERAAFLAGCCSGDLSVEYYSYLEDGLKRALSLAEDGDVVGLLGGDTLRRGQLVLERALSARADLLEREPFDEMEQEPLAKPLL